MVHRTWASGYTLHLASQHPHLQPDAYHTGDPAGISFSCYHNPGDHSALLTRQHYCQGVSYSARTSYTGAKLGLPTHNCPQSGSFLRVNSASPSAAFATTCYHACNLGRTMLWPATRSHPHRCSGVYSTGLDILDLSHHLAVCTGTAAVADSASGRCSRSSS